MKRGAVVLGAVVAALVMLLGAVPASASSTGLDGDLVKDKWVNYTNSRTVEEGGSNIYVSKSDGPAMIIRWRKCTDPSRRGSDVHMQNADPTPRYTVGVNFIDGAVFCLSAYSKGNNGTDRWSGTLEWNVFS